MKAEELARYDGLGLADLVRRREVSATELLDASIARVEALNPEINAVVTRLSPATTSCSRRRCAGRPTHSA